MLLLVYRSVFTVILLLLMVGIELQVARGFVAFLGHHGIIGLTTFVVNMLASIGIAAGTDYGIFFIGRYQEARQAGEDRETAFYTTYRGVAKVVLASGSTIAGALFCLSFTRLPSFQALGVPCAVGIFVAVAVALTLVPAVIAVGSRVGLFDPKRMIRVRGWRRVGTAIVRWPAPILAATVSSHAYRAFNVAELQTQLQRPEVHPQRYPRQSWVCSCRSTFPPVPNDDARDPLGRGRSRSAQFGGFSRIEQTGQSGTRGSRHFQCAVHNSSYWDSDPAYVYTIYAQHAKRWHASKIWGFRKTA